MTLFDTMCCINPRREWNSSVACSDVITDLPIMYVIIIYWKLCFCRIGIFFLLLFSFNVNPRQITYNTLNIFYLYRRRGSVLLNNEQLWFPFYCMTIILKYFNTILKNMFLNVVMLYNTIPIYGHTHFISD